ncbi:MAG: sodium-dependent transporter [Pseudomonadaceae bacterium]|nr:sodium-dependent transporter [Pseudomonadaceae bacterium]
MALAGESRHGMWSNKWLFVLAAAGSAVGLGNIWKFPYIAGENGGGAFVLVYLACVFLIGIPIMMSEVLIGRHGRQSPINAVRSLVAKSKASSFWVLIGWMGVLAGFLILSFYAVIAGWALHYGWLMGVGTFQNADGAMAGATFDAFLANPWMLLGYQTLFMVVTVWIVSRGVIKGLETAIRWFMPLLFVLLLVLLGYGITSGGFPEAVDFMFAFNWDALSWDGVLVAMGQAFFTLSLGMGAIMAYGAYLPDDASIPGTVTTIALLDTFVAVAAGLVVFSIVFANDLDPSSGPGLMFVTIPLALGSLPAGEIFGVVFFVLVTFAAITSAISLTEPALAYLVEEYNAKRGRVAISLGVICWILGIGSVLSFNVWADVYVVGSLTIFDFFDYVSQNIMLPLGGLLIVLFAAFVLPRELVRRQIGFDGGVAEILWLLLARVVAPLGVLAVFVYTLYQSFA